MTQGRNVFTSKMEMETCAMVSEVVMLRSVGVSVKVVMPMDNHMINFEISLSTTYCC